MYSFLVCVCVCAVEAMYCKVPCIRPSPPMHDFDPKVGGGRLQGTTPLHGGSPSYIKR